MTPRLLNPDHFRHHVDYFNAMEPEGVVNLIPNAQAWDWMVENVPLFACPDPVLERAYYFRWWTYRKHIKQTPVGRIVTEFIEPVRHAGAFNSISCAFGHHLAEGRWLRDQCFLDEYTRFWFRMHNGRPELKFHKYSSWAAAALLDRARVTGDFDLLEDLFEDLVADYRVWETEKRRDDGLFWQYDVWDAMEESISGSRKHRNARPTINSYMFGNARAIAQLAGRFHRHPLAAEFAAKANELRRLVQDKLWDASARFFKAQTEENGLSDAREAIGFIPWMFDLPDRDAGFEHAWAQLPDERGFWAAYGLTTAERRHPRFRSHGVGKCEWDGAVWPFATSQTLAGLANVLRTRRQPHVHRGHYVQAVRIYAQSMQMNGRPYIGEYLCESTGAWLKGDNPRSRYYNHSTFADLVIGGLCGVLPHDDGAIDIDPLLTDNAWDWFCLDGVPFHGKRLSIRWDRQGTRFSDQKGLFVDADGENVARRPTLARNTAP